MKTYSTYRRVIPIIISGCVLLSLIMFFEVRHSVTQSFKARFNRIANLRINTIHMAIENHFETIRSISAFFNSSSYITRDNFQDFVTTILTHHRNIKALGWIPQVRYIQKAAYEEAAYIDGYLDFKLSDSEKKTKKVFFPLYYLEPYAENKEIFGFDFSSDPVLKAAMSQAKDSRKITVISRNKLLRKMNIQHGIIVLLPVFDRLVTNTSGTDQASLRGFVMAIFKINEIVDNAISTLPKQVTDIFIYDAAEASEENLFYKYLSHSYKNICTVDQSFSISKTIAIGDKKWLIQCKPCEELFAVKTIWKAWGVLLGGILLTFLLYNFLKNNIKRSIQIEELVEKLSNEIEERKKIEDRLIKSEISSRSLLQNLPQKIFLKDKNSVYILCNESFARDLNIEPDDIVGKTDYDLYPKYLADKYRDDDKRIMVSGLTEDLEERYFQEGKETVVQTVKSPVRNENSNIVGVLGIFWEITERKKIEEALRKSQRLLAEAQRIANLGSWEWDIRNNQIECSNEVYRILGLNPTQFDVNIYKAFTDCVHPDDSQKVKEAVSQALYQKKPYNIVHRVILPGGLERIVHVQGEVSWDLYNKPIRMVGTVHNITKYKRVEEALKRHRDKLEVMVEERTKELRDSEQKLLALMNSISETVLLIDSNGIILTINETGAKRFNKTVDEIIGKNIFDYLPPELAVSRRTKIQEVIKEKKACIFEDQRDLYYFMNNVYPVFDENGQVDRLAVFASDITERKKAEAKLRESLIEKEVLLQEIHHRVKNNMQIISSLIGLQIRNIKEQAYVDMLRESQSRIKTMALVHEKLYRSESLDNIDFHDYITNLCNDLLMSFGIISNRVILTIEADKVFLPLDTAIPCGLIINELISNSLKHAFPDSRHGKIQIKLYPIDTKQFALIVYDNGIGIQKEIDFRKTETLGLNIVGTLVRQLKGKIELNKNNGTEFRISFKT